MKIKHKLVIATTIAISYGVVGTSTPVQAAQLFSFNYSFPGITSSDPSITASGVFTTTDLDPQTATYTITGITGTRNGEQIKSLLPPYLSYGTNDNLLNANQPFLKSTGFSYEVAGSGDDGEGDVNVNYTPSGYTEYANNVGFGSFAVSPLTATPNLTVPEPDLNLGTTIIIGGIVAWSLKQKNLI